MFPFSDKITFRSLIVAQAWSTCYELYFYFFMALLLLFHVPKRAILWGLGVVFVLFFPLSLIRTPMSEYGFGRYLLSLVGSIHILKFLVGIIIAIYYSRYVSNSCRKKYKVSPIVVMVCFILYFFMLLIPYNHVVAFVGSLILFICVLYSNKYVDKWKECAVKKFCIYLGDISFSIYLIHLLVIRFFIEVCGVQSLFLLMSITIVSTLLLSMFTYRYIEQPCIRFAKK